MFEGLGNFWDIGRRIDFGRNFDRLPFTPPLVAGFGPLPSILTHASHAWNYKVITTCPSSTPEFGLWDRTWVSHSGGTVYMNSYSLVFQHMPLTCETARRLRSRWIPVILRKTRFRSMCSCRSFLHEWCVYGVCVWSGCACV